MNELPVVLFVDDDPLVIEGVRRLLFPLNDQWNFVFETDPAKAFQLIKTENYFAVFSDMQMPELDGLAILKLTKEKQPAARRIIVSGQVSSQSSAEVRNFTHFLLSKPCDYDEIIACLVDPIEN